MEDVLRDALSEDNAIRRTAEQRLSCGKLRRGYSVALARRLAKNAPPSGSVVGDVSTSSADHMFMPKRLMAGMLLQQFVQDHWAARGRPAIPPEDKAQVRHLVVAAMMDASAPRAARASAARSVALMAVGGEWPEGWGGLVPQLLWQLGVAAAAVASSGGGRNGGGGAAGGEAGRGQAESAIARAESCTKCLQYMAEEVPMEHVPELFQQAFPGLLKAGEVYGLPRKIRAKVFRIVRELFESIGTLVTVGGKTAFLPWLQQWVPPWLHLVSKTLQLAVEANNNADEDRETPGAKEEKGPAAAPVIGIREGGVARNGAVSSRNGNGFRGKEFSVELEALRTGMVLLTRVPSAVGDGHLGQLLPPLWGLLTKGLPEHERFVMADSGGGEGEDDADKGYASDGEGHGFEDLIVEALGLLAAIAACPERQVSALLGGEGAGLGPLLAVVIRYLQLTEESATLWEEAPNEFLEQDEGEEEEGRGVTAGGARSAGLSLIREICDAFPEKAVPALIDEAKAALADPVGLQGVSREEITGVGETPEASEAVAAAAAAAKGRQWRLREAILLSLGAGSKAIIRQVNRRCPLAAKVKHSSGGRGHPRSGGCKGKKNKGGSTYSPGILCAGARGLGLDLGGFQAVALAAAEGRDPGAPNSSLVQARGLWLSARFAPLLSAEGVCKAAEACAEALQSERPPQPDLPLGLRLYACRALGMLSRHSARMVRRDQGSKGIAGRSICGPRIGSAARLAVDYASGLAASCEETTAHLVPETMIQLVKGYPLQVTQKGGGLLLIHLAMSMWEQYPCDPAVVEVVEDLLLAMTRIPQVVPQMIETVVPFLPEVFKQVRAGNEDLQAVAQGSLSLLRQLIRRVGRPRSSVADAPARRALLGALRGACPLLLTTDSHVLLQDGCKTLRTFVSALGADIASSSPSPPPPPQQQQIPPSPPSTSGPTPRSPLYPPPPPPPSMTPPSTLPITPPPLPPSRSPSPRTTPGGRGIIAGRVKDVTASVSISINWHGPLSSSPPPRGVIVVRGGGSDYRGHNTEVAGGVAGGGFVRDDRGLDSEGEGVIGGGGRGGACPEGWASGSCPHALTHCDDSTLSMVLAFLYRVMARGVHEASAMYTGGLVSAILRHIPLSYLGEETVHELLSKTFDKLQRSSSSLLTDELLRVFIGFVNHEAYGASTLVDVLVRIDRIDAHAERPCRCPGDAEAETDGCLSGNSDGNTISSRRRRRGSQGGSDGVDGSDEALAEAVNGRGQGSEERDRGGGDELASFRRLMGLWLYFHENAQNSNQTKRSALGLTRLLNAASHGDPRLCCLRVSTDDMYSKGEIGGASGERGQGMRRKYLAPSLRAMEGQLLPVCLLMSIIRTARDFGGKDEEPGGRKHDHVNRSGEDADVMGDAFGDHGVLRASNAGESSDSEESSDAQGSDDDDQDGTGSDDGRVRKRDGQCFKPKRFNVRSDVLGLAALADLDDDERRTSATSVSTPASPKTSVTAVAGGNSTTSNAKVTSSSSTGGGNVDSANAAIGNGVVATDDRLGHGGDGMATEVVKVSLPPSAPVAYRVSSAPACGYYPSSVPFPGPDRCSGPKRTTAMTMGQPWSVVAARDDNAAADVVPPSEGGGTGNARRHNRPQASIHHRTFSDNGGVRLVGGVLSQSSSCGEEGARGRDGEGFARVSARRWNSDGVATGLVRFLKAASGKSEERLRAWAGMLPDEEQAALTALLQAA